MDIFLMRHGIAADLQLAESDAARAAFSEENRELTTKGITKTKRVAFSMREKGWKFDLVLASPLLRACQTAQILLESGLSEALEIHPPLAPNGLLDDWLQWLESYRLINPTTKRLALVGHEPNLSQWAEMLMFGQVFDRIHLKKAGVIALQIPDTIDIVGKCELLWLVPPKFWT